MNALTVPQIAERLGVDPSLVRAWCRKGKIKAEKAGRDWLATPAAVATFEANRAGRGRPRGNMREVR